MSSSWAGTDDELKDYLQNKQAGNHAAKQAFQVIQQQAQQMGYNIDDPGHQEKFLSLFRLHRKQHGNQKNSFDEGWNDAIALILDLDNDY